MNTSPVKIWRNQGHIRNLLGKTGVIVSFTIIRVPPGGFEGQAPYAVVVVDLGDSKCTGQLVDYNEKELKIGKRVIAVLRRVKQPDTEGIIPYGVKFKPV